MFKIKILNICACAKRKKIHILFLLLPVLSFKRKKKNNKTKQTAKLDSIMSISFRFMPTETYKYSCLHIAWISFDEPSSKIKNKIQELHDLLCEMEIYDEKLLL